jgi:hypothetical protein
MKFNRRFSFFREYRSHHSEELWSDWAVIDAELLVDKRQNDPPSAIEGDGDCRQQRSRQQNVNGTSLDELWLSKRNSRASISS